ncbi:MAG TPA: tetratricopeptide repeat protein [Chthonomonadaceae bacterium]|nr:tetratricopeptide repeat protein [Chthonomonadaceae bacterium]
MLLTLLLLSASLVLYRIAASRRAEYVLRHASLSELQAVAARDADNPRVFYYLGLRAQEAGQGPLAMSAFLRAATLAPDDEKLWLIWSQTAFSVQGSQAARDILLTFIKVHPKNVLAHMQLAKLMEQEGSLSDAYEVAQRATKLEPQSAAAWQLLGKVALEQHNSGQAESAFRRAIALRPQDSFSHASLGDAFFLMSRYPEAAAAYHEAVRLAPHMGTAYMALGQTLLKMASSPEEIEAARANLQQALARLATMQQTGLYYTYLCLGQSYARQSRWKEALPWLKQAEAIQAPSADSNNDAHFELAQVYRALHDSANAAREMALHQKLVAYFLQVRALTSRLSAYPNDTQASLRLARLFASHQDYPQADKAYRSALAYAADKQAVRQERDALVGRHPGAR